MGCYPAKFKGYYLTAYGLAVKHGYIGTEEEWLASLEAGDIEMKYEDGVLSYKTTKETEWRELPEFGKVTADLEAAAQAAEEAAERANTVTEEANTTLGQVQDSLFQANGQIADLEEKNENLSLWETYDPLKTYQPLNKVSYNGSSYVCILESTGNLPTDDVHWLMIAGKGEKGDPGGPQGEPGPPGEPGKDARKTVRFVIGTSTNGWTEDDCDYLCDGVDDQAEMAEAIKALPESGGEIKFLDGEYSLSNQLSVNKKCLLTGYGAVFKKNHVVPAVAVVSGGDTSISGILFTRDESYSASNTLDTGVRCASGGKAKVKDCSFKNLHDGVYGCKNVEDCIFDTCYRGATVSGSDNCSYSHNTFLSCEDYGLSFGATGDVSFNYFQSCTKSIVLDNATSSAIEGNSIEDYREQDNSFVGVEASDCLNTTVIGNTINRILGYKETDYSILLSGSGNTNNLIAYNSIMGKNIVDEGGTNNTFEGNKFE